MIKCDVYDKSCPNLSVQSELVFVMYIGCLCSLAKLILEEKVSLLLNGSILDPQPQTAMWCKTPSKPRTHSKHCKCIPHKVNLPSQRKPLPPNIVQLLLRQFSYPPDVCCTHACLPCRAEDVCCSNICIIFFTSVSTLPSSQTPGLAWSHLDESNESRDLG